MESIWGNITYIIKILVMLTHINILVILVIYSCQCVHVLLILSGRHIQYTSR